MSKEPQSDSKTKETLSTANRIEELYQEHWNGAAHKLGDIGYVCPTCTEFITLKSNVLAEEAITERRIKALKADRTQERAEVAKRLKEWIEMYWANQPAEDKLKAIIADLNHEGDGSR